ncbi:hypothetical protein HK101_002789 [Irineochytrium annulatum]|nr:hypothetical protein HK101_002789 [Irineochytrium annulatum]
MSSASANWRLDRPESRPPPAWGRSSPHQDRTARSAAVKTIPHHPLSSRPAAGKKPLVDNSECRRTSGAVSAQDRAAAERARLTEMNRRNRFLTLPSLVVDAILSHLHPHQVMILRQRLCKNFLPSFGTIAFARLNLMMWRSWAHDHTSAADGMSQSCVNVHGDYSSTTAALLNLRKWQGRYWANSAAVDQGDDDEDDDDGDEDLDNSDEDAVDEAVVEDGDGQDASGVQVEEEEDVTTYVTALFIVWGFTISSVNLIQPGWRREIEERKDRIFSPNLKPDDVLLTHVKRGLMLAATSPHFDPTADADFAPLWCAASGSVDCLERLVKCCRGRIPLATLQSCFTMASRFGHAGICRRLLAFKDDIDRTLDVDPAYDENLAICVAAQEGHPEVVAMLLEIPGVEPSAYNNHAILLSSFHGHESVVRMLLDSGRVDPSVNEDDAIAFACKRGHANILQMLLEDPRCDPSSDQDYALRVSSELGHVECVKILLRTGRVNVRAMDDLPLCLAAMQGRTEVVKLLLGDPIAEMVDVEGDPTYPGAPRVRRMLVRTRSTNVNPAAQSNYPLRHASANGHAEVVKLLLATGQTDPGCDDNICLQMAAQNSHAACVKLLLDTNACNPGADDGFALRQSCQNGDVEVTKLLLAHAWTDPAVGGDAPLQLACQRGSAECVNLLLCTKRVNIEAEQGFALRIACEKGFDDIVEMLLTNGADATAMGCCGLKLAAANGHDRVVGRLLQRGLGSDPLLGSATTAALQAACQNGWARCARELVKNCRFLELMAGEGFALSIACRNGHEACVEVLVGAGVDPSCGSYTALIVACRNGNQGCVGKVLGSMKGRAGGIAAERAVHCAAVACVEGAQVECLKLLVAHGLDVSRGRFELLRRVVELQGRECAVVLMDEVERQANLEGRTSKRVMMACVRGMEAVVGAAMMVRAERVDVERAASVAARLGEVACLRRLIEAQDKVFVPVFEGACRMDKASVVELLVETWGVQELGKEIVEKMLREATAAGRYGVMRQLRKFLEV